jgi:polar amino acid transport system substrate-binding protein
MTMHRLTVAAALSAIALLPPVAAARSLQQVLNSGTLRVGVALFTPWATRTGNGDLVGFEVDVARQVAADMGVKAELLTYEFDRLIPALEAGEIDLIASGLTVTPERALHVNFSQPYAESGISLATHLQSTQDVRRLEDLDDPAYTLAAVEGSVAVDVVARLLPRAKLRQFPSVEAASAALIAGDVHGYLEDEPIPAYLALENPTVVDVPLARPLLQSRAAFAIGKGDADFLAFLNAWITAREADTWLPTTTSYWFESLRWRQRLESAER